MDISNLSEYIFVFSWKHRKLPSMASKNNNEMYVTILYIVHLDETDELFLFLVKTYLNMY